MEITKQEAIDIATKVLTDIEFLIDEDTDPSARRIEGEYLFIFNTETPIWLVSFDYGSESFGKGNASVHLGVDEITGRVVGPISHRHGSIYLSYDEAKDTYSEKERPGSK